jgi:hypothetical protein
MQPPDGAADVAVVVSPRPLYDHDESFDDEDDDDEPLLL